MRKNLFVLSLIALTTFGVSSCEGSGGGTQNCPEGPRYEIVEVVKEFTLTVEESSGATVKELTGLTNNKCESGSKVTFKVELSEHFALDKVEVAGDVLTPDSTGLYSFRMPNADAKLTVTTIDLTGGNDLLTVSKLGDDFVGPKTLEEFKTALDTSVSVDGKYFKEATNKTEYDPIIKDDSKYSRNLFDFKIKASRNGIVKKEGVSGKASEDFLKFSSETLGRKGDYLYKIDESSDNKKLSTTAETFKIVSDDTQELKSYEKTTTSANNLTSGYLYGEKLQNTYLGSSTNFKEDKTTVDTVIAENKETYTVTLSSTGTYSSYSGQDFYELKVTFDGDNFLTESTYTYKKYGKEAFDPDKNLIEGAIPNFIYSDVYKATRGYKEEVFVEPDLESLTFKTYDVLISNAISGETVKVRNDGTIYIFGNTTFNYESKGDSKSAITPRFVGISKGAVEDVIIDGQAIKFTKPGAYELDFDNGLGEIKTIKLDVQVPATKTISANFADKKTIVETPNILKVSSSPEGSDSKVTVTPKSTSVQCEVVENEDGTFTVTAKEPGKVELDVTLISNTEIKASASFEAVAKPTYEDVFANITTKSLYKYYSGGRYYVNFNEDGTGVAYYEEYSTLDSTTTFKYTLDRDTLEFKFSDFVYDGATKFVSAKVVTAEEFVGSFEYNTSVTDYEMTLTNRKTY